MKQSLPTGCVRSERAYASSDRQAPEASFRLDLGVAHDVMPLFAVGLDEGGELLRRAEHRLKQVVCEELLKLRVLEHLPHLAVDASDNVPRRPARRKQPKPGYGL